MRFFTLAALLEGEERGGGQGAGGGGGGEQGQLCGWVDGGAPQKLPFLLLR